MHEALRSMVNSTWSTNMRIGIVAVLHNRVGMLHFCIYSYTFICVMLKEFIKN